MSVCRLVAGLVGLALAAVVVIVLVAVGSEVRAELARRSPRRALHPRRQHSVRVVCRRHGPTGVNGGTLQPSGSFALHGQPEAHREHPTHRDEVERLSSTTVSAQHPVVMAARLWNRSSPFALASSIPQGTAPFRQA